MLPYRYNMIPLSRLGLDKEDQELLSKRLFPEANKIFLQNISKNMNLNYEKIQQLDYSDHPVYKHEKMMANRHYKAKTIGDRIKKGYVNVIEYPYKSIDEARKAGVNVVEPEPELSPDELNKQLEEIKIRDRKIQGLSDLSSDDEKVDEDTEDDEKIPDILELRRTKRRDSRGYYKF